MIDGKKEVPVKEEERKKDDKKAKANGAAPEE